MKIMVNYFVPLLVTTVLIFSVSACNQKDTSTQVEAKKSQTYMRTVKPHAAVFMEYTLPQHLENNQALPVEITIMSGQTVDNLIVKLRSSEGLQTADVLEYSFGKQLAGQKNTQQITVQAAADGQYRLYVTASLVSGNKAQSRSFIIPINIGKQTAAPKRKAVGVMIENQGGEKIISMPATEH